MALRRFASQSVSMLGIRAAAPTQGIAAAGDCSLRAVACRAFATVVDGLKYAKSHEWVKLDGDTATVGITDFAQSELGDVVYVELPEVGASVKKGETFGVIESVKAATDLYSPMSGEVVETNNDLVDDPGKVNTQPYDAWIMKVKVSAPAEEGDLLGSQDYSTHCEAGGH